MHPGTVATDLSAPVTGGHDPAALFAPQRAAQQLLEVFENLTIDDSGGFCADDGGAIPQVAALGVRRARRSWGFP